MLKEKDGVNGSLVEEVFLGERFFQKYGLMIYFVFWGLKRLNNIIGLIRIGKQKVGMVDI